MPINRIPLWQNIGFRRYWACDPNALRLIRSDHRIGKISDIFHDYVIMLWIGIWLDEMIGPCFFDDDISGQTYLQNFFSEFSGR
jgi:hypothetical protein